MFWNKCKRQYSTIEPTEYVKHVCISQLPGRFVSLKGVHGVFNSQFFYSISVLGVSEAIFSFRRGSHNCPYFCIRNTLVKSLSQIVCAVFSLSHAHLIQYSVRRILRPQINYFWGGNAFPVEIRGTFVDFPDRVSRKIFNEEELDVKNVIRSGAASCNRFRRDKWQPPCLRERKNKTETSDGALEISQIPVID